MCVEYTLSGGRVETTRHSRGINFFRLALSLQLGLELFNLLFVVDEALAIDVHRVIKISKERRVLSAIFSELFAGERLHLHGRELFVETLRPNQMLLNDIINRQLTELRILDEKLYAVHEVVHDLRALNHEMSQRVQRLFD